MADDKTNEVLEVNAEEIDPVEDQIKKEIVRFNLADAKINEMKLNYGQLVINGTDDKDGYNKVSEAYAVVKKARTGIENKRKTIKDGYLKVGAAIDFEAKRLTNLLKPLEEDLKSKKEAIDNEKERLKKLKEKEEEEKLNARITELIKEGMVFDGSCYAIGDTISIDVVTVRNLPQDKYEVLKAKVQFEKQRIDKEAEEKRLEEQRKKEEFEKQQEQLRLQQEEFQRQQEQLRLQQEEFQRQQQQLKQQQEQAEQERQRLEQQRIQNEKLAAEQKWKDLVNAVNMSFTAAGMLRRSELVWVFENEFGSYTATLDKENPMTYKEAKQKAEEISPKIAEWKRQQLDKEAEETKKREKEAKEELERQEAAKRRMQERYQQLSSLGMTYNGQHDAYIFQDVNVDNKTEINLFNEEEWAALIGKITPIIAQRKEEAEQKRQAGLNDQQKLNEYVGLLRAVPGPGILSTPEASQKYGKFYDEFNALMDKLSS